MDDKPTGAGSSAGDFRRLGDPLMGNAETAATMPNGYTEARRASAERGADSELPSVISKPRRKKDARAGKAPLADASSPQERYARQRHLARAKDLAGEMLEAARQEDEVALIAAGADFLRCLRELWRLRKGREDEWAEVVHYVQSALSGEVFEAFTPEQCQVIQKIITEHVAAGIVDSDQPLRVKRLLREAGFDPWKAVSHR